MDYMYGCVCGQLCQPPPSPFPVHGVALPGVTGADSSLKRCSGGVSGVGMQARDCAPTLGVFKGALGVKTGIDTKQWFPSMRQVTPCTTSNEDWAVLVACRTRPGYDTALP